MSGPKVVRVVTREELIEIGSSLLRKLDSKIEQWAGELSRLGLQDVALLEAVRLRRTEIASSFAEERFADVQRHVPVEIAFLEKDIERKREQAAEIAVKNVQHARQLRENAQSLIDNLVRHKIADDELRSSLLRIVKGGLKGPVAQAAIARGFSALASVKKGGLSDSQVELAKQLQGQSDVPGQEQWFVGKGAPDHRLKQIDDALARLEVALDKNAIQGYLQRLQDIEGVRAEPSFQLQLDSLLLDVAAEQQRVTMRAVELAEAGDIVRELRHVKPQLVAEEYQVLISLEAEIENGVGNRLQDLIASGRALLSDISKSVAAKARRDAVLLGLAELGYEVREGMATAWASKGSIVVKNPNLPGYGVELGGASDASRLQVRAVAFDASRDVVRDRDIETIWCGDFGKLQQIVALQGGNIAIERALEVGSAPLKVVSSAAEEHRVEKTHPKGKVER